MTAIITNVASSLRSLLTKKPRTPVFAYSVDDLKTKLDTAQQTGQGVNSTHFRYDGLRAFEADRELVRSVFTKDDPTVVISVVTDTRGETFHAHLFCQTEGNEHQGHPVWIEFHGDVYPPGDPSEPYENPIGRPNMIISADPTVAQVDKTLRAMILGMYNTRAGVDPDAPASEQDTEAPFGFQMISDATRKTLQEYLDKGISRFQKELLVQETEENEESVDALEERDDPLEWIH